MVISSVYQNKQVQHLNYGTGTDLKWSKTFIWQIQNNDVFGEVQSQKNISYQSFTIPLYKPNASKELQF